MRVTFPSEAQCYHRISPDRIVVAVNTDMILPIAHPSDKPLPRSDGWWGPHEYTIVPQLLNKSSPYLAWIPSLDSYANPHFQSDTGLDPTLIRLSFHEYPLLPVVGDPQSPSKSISPPVSPNIPGLPPKLQISQLTKPRLHRLFRSSPSMRSIIKQKSAELTAQASAAFSAVRDEARFHAIQIPEPALFRLEQANLWNGLQNSEAGHRLVLAGLKRAALELHAFLLWRRDQLQISAGGPVRDTSRRNYRVRGVYVNDLADLDDLQKFKVPLYIQFNAERIILPRRIRSVDLTPLPIHFDVLFPAGYIGGHHCSILFYPPIVPDSDKFELAARGYHSRTDEYRANRDIDKIFNNMRNDHYVAEKVNLPLVKAPPNHAMQRARQEYDKVQPFAPVPLPAWYHAWRQMEYPATVMGQNRTKFRTAVPPPFFFFNAATPQKQRPYFYIWLCIREELAHRWVNGNPLQRDQLLLTHARWREVLSGEIFKKNASPTDSFKLETFWRSDPGFIFQNAVKARNLTPLLVDGTPLLPQTFEDSHPAAFALTQFLCYDISVAHIQHQFEQADDAFLALKKLNPNSPEVIFRKNRREALFQKPTQFIDQTPAWESPDLPVRAAWYEQFRFFVKDWQINRPGCLEKDMSLLEEPAFSQEVQTMLIVYFEGVAHVLKTVPTTM